MGIKHCNKCEAREGCYEKSQGKWFTLEEIMKAATYNSSLDKPHHFYLRDLFAKGLLTGNIVKKKH